MLKPTLLTMGLCLAIASSSFAQESGLELFKSDIDVVVRLAEPDKTVESIVALVNGAQPGFGEIARGAVTQNLGKVISNPTLTGVDQSRDWHVGVYSNGQSEPNVVFAIPAIDTEVLTGVLNDEFKSSVHGTFVLYTDKGELPGVPAAAESVSSVMSENAKAAFSLGEISLYVNSKHLTGVYADELDTAYDQVLEGLNQLRFAMPQDSGVNMGAIIEMYGTIAEKLFQGVRDSTSLTVAVSLGENGVQVEEYLEFSGRSKSAKKLAELPPSEMKELYQLPEGGFTYYGVSGGTADVIKWSMDLTAGMAEDVETREKVKDAFTELSNVQFGTMVGMMSIGDTEGGIIHATSLANVTPVAGVKKFMRSSLKTMQELKLPGMTQSTQVDQDSETYGDLKADVITVKQKFDEDFPQAEMQEKMQKIMFGANGIQSRMVYLDGKYLTVMGGGEAATKAAIASLENTSNSNIEQRRNELMDKANFIALVDLPGGIAQGLRAASAVEDFPVPVDGQMIDNLNLKTSYIGFGITAEKDAIRCRTDVPMQQIQGLFKISMLFMGMRNQL